MVWMSWTDTSFKFSLCIFKCIWLWSLGVYFTILYFCLSWSDTLCLLHCITRENQPAQELNYRSTMWSRDTINENNLPPNFNIYNTLHSSRPMHEIPTLDTKPEPWGVNQALWLAWHASWNPVGQRPLDPSAGQPQAAHLPICTVSAGKFHRSLQFFSQLESCTLWTLNSQATLCLRPDRFVGVREWVTTKGTDWCCF